MQKFKQNLTRRVTVRFTEEQYRELEQVALEQAFNVSEVVRALALAFLRQRRKLSPLAGSRP